MRVMGQGNQELDPPPLPTPLLGARARIRPQVCSPGPFLHLSMRPWPTSICSPEIQMCSLLCAVDHTRFHHHPPPYIKKYINNVEQHHPVSLSSSPPRRGLMGSPAGFSRIRCRGWRRIGLKAKSGGWKIGLKPEASIRRRPCGSRSFDGCSRG